MRFGIIELIILAVCLGLPLLALGGAGLIFGLARWGVIGHHWLKGEEAVQAEGDYSLEQSQEVGND